MQESERTQTDFSVLITDHEAENTLRELDKGGQVGTEREKALLEFLLNILCYELKTL